MSYDKERAIAAQNAATAAATLLQGQAVSVEQFDELRTHIFNGTLVLANSAPQSVAAAVQEVFPGAEVVSAPASSSPELDVLGALEVKFGKYRGQTIADIDAIPESPDNRGGGRGWLEWASKNTSNDFMKRKIQDYLRLTAA